MCVCNLHNLLYILITVGQGQKVWKIFQRFQIPLFLIAVHGIISISDPQRPTQ